MALWVHEFIKTVDHRKLESKSKKFELLLNQLNRKPDINIYFCLNLIL